MTPEQIAGLTAVAAIVSKVGSWPIGSIIAIVVFGPWAVMWMVSRAMERRQEALMEMYKNNVKLVENYERVTDEQADTIRLSTAATVELTTYLKSRVPCHERMAERLVKRK